MTDVNQDHRVRLPVLGQIHEQVHSERLRSSYTSRTSSVTLSQDKVPLLLVCEPASSVLGSVNEDEWSDDAHERGE